jgi:hypothetical protein
VVDRTFEGEEHLPSRGRRFGPHHGGRIDLPLAIFSYPFGRVYFLVKTLSHKNPNPFDLRTVSESQKYKKKTGVFLFCRVTTKKFVIYDGKKSATKGIILVNQSKPATVMWRISRHL